MSAGSPSTAFVSLGMSCQSARQIRTSVEVLSAALGEPVEPERHFFDGLISPIAGLAQLFEDGFPIFSREQIVPGPGHPTWQPYGLRFLHHFRDETAADIDKHFEEDLSRFTYLRNKFCALKDRPRVVFVISNSQNNLIEVAEETAIDRIDFDHAELVRLQAAVDAFFARKFEYLIVSHPDRHGHVRLPTLKIMKADDSDWTGDKAQWRALFMDYLMQPELPPFAV